MAYSASETAPISKAATTSVVTRRDDKNRFSVSATQCKVNRRPCVPLQWSMCSPSADNSMGEVSALLLYVEVLQLGAGLACVAMTGSARPAAWPNGEMG